MGSFGTVSLKAIWEMLAKCAPGYTCKETDHNYRITWNGKVYPSLPLGPHGKGNNVAIEKGHVKKMARSLGILECAKQALGL